MLEFCEFENGRSREFFDYYQRDYDLLLKAIDEIYMPCMDERREANLDLLALRERDYVRAFDENSMERPIIDPRYAVLNLEAFAGRHRMAESLTVLGDMYRLRERFGLFESKKYIREFDEDEKKNFGCRLMEEVLREESLIKKMKSEGWIYLRSSSINHFSTINGHIFGEHDRLFFSHEYEKGRYIPGIEFKNFDEVSSFLQKIRREHEIETESRKEPAESNGQKIRCRAEDWNHLKTERDAEGTAILVRRINPGRPLIRSKM